MPRKKKRSPKPPPSRRKVICLVAGEFEGRQGWLDASNPCSDSDYWTYVIVDLDGVDYPTRVRTTIVGGYTMPSTYVEHCLFQHPDITKLMRKLCKGLSECDLKVDDEAEVVELFEKKLRKAVQANTGRNARMRVVQYNKKERKGKRDGAENQLV